MMIYANTPPAYSFQGNTKEYPPSSQQVPGPGHYDPALKSPQLLTHFSKSDKFAPIKPQAPGPGAYDPLPVIGEGPKASIRPRPDAKYDTAVPGPGAYEPVNPREQVAPIHFSKAPKDKSFKTGVPGPGEYNPMAREGGPSWSFLGHGKEGIRGDSVGSEGRKSARNDSPGPGYYEVGNSLANTLPGFWGSKAKKEPSYIHPSASPGPTAYDPKLISKQDRVSGLGKSPKLPDYKSFTPGPGHYDPKSQDTPVKVTLKSRLTDLDLERRKKLPGPGYYSPVRPDELHGTSLALSKGERDYSYLSKGNAPAPGAYDPVDPFRSNRGFSFSKAGKLVMGPALGPQYEIPSSIGIIQSYHKRK